MLKTLAATILLSTIAAGQSCDIVQLTSSNMAAHIQCTKMGSLYIGSNDFTSSVALPSLTEIQNDLTIEKNFALPDVAFDGLKSIGGNMVVQNNTGMEKLSIPSLTSVGSLKIVTNPALRALDFGRGLSSAKSIEVVNNGRLASLTGVTVSGLDTLTIDGNPSLDSTTFSNLEHINALHVGIRNTASFPRLTVCNGDFISTQVSSLSLPSLQHVFGKVDISETRMTNLSLPVQEVHKDLSLRSNPSLSTVSMPNLKTVGGTIFVANDTMLKELAMSALVSVKGSVDVSSKALRNFSMPSIQNIDGALKVAAPVSCGSLSELKNGVVNGNYSCISSPEASNTTSTGTNPFGNTTSTNGTEVDGIDGNAKASEAAATQGLFGILVFVMYLTCVV